MVFDWVMLNCIRYSRRLMQSSRRGESRDWLAWKHAEGRAIQPPAYPSLIADCSQHTWSRVTFFRR